MYTQQNCIMLCIPQHYKFPRSNDICTSVLLLSTAAIIDNSNEDKNKYSSNYLIGVSRFVDSVNVIVTIAPVMTMINDLALQPRNWTLEAGRRGMNIYITIYFTETRQGERREPPGYIGCIC